MILDFLQDTAEKLTDVVMASVPRATPPKDKLKAAKLVAHRGNGTSHPENSLAAFRALADAGVWGIEFDIRFTSDSVPVLSHDSNLKRCFGIDHEIESKTFNELYQSKLSVPTLAEVLSEFRGRLHFMIEIKSREKPFSEFDVNVLRDILQEQVPGRDYHLMALEPELFDSFHWAPRAACLSISMLNSKSISKKTIERKLGGHTGHYVLLSETLRLKHEKENQKIGTGFISSRNVLYREVSRGVEWLYSDRALELQKIINDSN